MSAAAEIAEVVARLRNRSLAVCDDCGGEGYTDMGKSACAVCFGAGVTTPEMLVALQAEERRAILASAVALCMNDDHLTDLATLKRSWFYAETGRDEPVGSRTWEWLRVMVRGHQTPADPPPSATSGGR